MNLIIFDEKVDEATMAQINIKDKNYLIKIIKASIFPFWTVFLSLLLSILILKDRFAVLFLGILIISNLKEMLLIFRRNFSGRDLVKALKPNRSIQLPEQDLETAIELVRLNLVTEPEVYCLVLMPGVAIFCPERSLLLLRLRPKHFYCLETNENGTKLSTYAGSIPFLFRALRPELAIE